MSGLSEEYKEVLRGQQSRMAERPCMMEQSIAELERRYRPRSDGSPGREVECETCGGVWAIGIGGRPLECRKPCR
jgi:hypothetical protein